jgi:negative regulator of replication initiation
MGRTTISVSDEVADELHNMKRRGESYDDVLRRVINVEADDSATESAAEGHIDTSTPTPDVDREALAEALAGSGDVLERRVDAVVEMYAHLREEGAAEKSDLLDAIDVDATGYDSEASVWANMVKGRDTLRALPGVEPPSAGMSTWRYTR